MLVKRTKKPKPDPVERTIMLKEKLIKRLRADISELQADCAANVKKIEFRIKMAQTLVDALHSSQEEKN